MLSGMSDTGAGGLLRVLPAVRAGVQDAAGMQQGEEGRGQERLHARKDKRQTLLEAE